MFRVMGILRRIDKAVDRAGYWYAAWGLVTPMMSWLWKQTSLLASASWADAILLGIFSTLICISVVSLGLVAWRHFRPLPPLASLPLEIEAQPSLGEVSHPETTTPDLTPFEPEGLYFGFMQVSTGDLDDKGVIEVVARCFNATGHVLDLQRVEGQIKMSESSDGNQTEVGDLPRCWFSSGRSGRAPDRNIANLSEFMLILEQPLPPAIASKFRGVKDGQTLSLNLSGLHVVVSQHGAPYETAILPLWGGILIRRGGDSLQSGRITYASAAITGG